MEKLIMEFYLKNFINIILKIILVKQHHLIQYLTNKTFPTRQILLLL